MKTIILNCAMGLLLIFSATVSQADFHDEESGKAFLGFGLGDVDVTPLVFGADYRFLLDSVDFFEDNDLKLLGGFLYWGASNSGLDFSVLELSSGIEKSLRYRDYVINFGGRVGVARTEVSVRNFFGSAFSNTDTSLFISPYGEFIYPINDEMAIGGEVRLPIYLGSGFDFLDVFYMLASFNYIF